MAMAISGFKFLPFQGSLAETGPKLGWLAGRKETADWRRLVPNKLWIFRTFLRYHLQIDERVL